jgi:hypothetical protein
VTIRFPIGKGNPPKEEQTKPEKEDAGMGQQLKLKLKQTLI